MQDTNTYHDLDLMKSNQNKFIKNYVDIIYSMSFFPMTKPTHIICGTATLIDNIFTNSLDHRFVSGVLLSDFSDLSTFRYSVSVFILFLMHAQVVTVQKIYSPYYTTCYEIIIRRFVD